MPHRTCSRMLLALLLVLTTAAIARADELEIKVLSNRADLVSGGDALVQIVIPPDVTASDVHVTLNGSDVTSAFGTRTSDGHFVGLITGLNAGDNDVVAFVTPPTLKLPAEITISNHAIGGPVFAGAQLLPWICARKVATSVTVTVPNTSLSGTATTKVNGLASDPVDDQCDTLPTFTYFYEPTSKVGTGCTFTTTGANPCFQSYDPSNPPPANTIANFTNDRGDTVRAIVVLEKGTLNRGEYQLVTFFDPSQPNSPQDPQRGWNGKLLWVFGASSGVSRFQTPPGSGVFDNNALSRGYMVASSSLTDHGTNSNDTLAAETVAMLKEEITENYGEIRYTIGAGCSGGSILQYNIAAAYPELLQGIQPNCTFPDTMSTAIEVTDCGLLDQKYYATANGSALTAAQKAAIDGHTNTGMCVAWNLSFLPFGNPTIASNCGSGFPTSVTYDPATRPNGVRCTTFDHDASTLGTFVDTDGNTKANTPVDNVGVEYGLKALQAGTITPEQFVQLNEGVGSFNADLIWVPPTRAVASASTLHTVYTAGLLTDGHQLANIAIIDLRGNQAVNGDIHQNWRAWEARARLDNANGTHANQLIWAYNSTSGAGAPGAALVLNSFTTLDTWLANIEADASNSPLPTKVLNDKPAGAGDLCLTTTGSTQAQIVDVGLGTPACPIKFQSSPRQAAGGPLSEDIFKCQLKALDFNDPDFTGITFTTDQQNRLGAIFPGGVCDWTQPGVGQAPSDGGSTFAAGPGGQPLGPEPESESVPPICGDGVVSGETCDDGNTTSGDGCSATCTVEPGFTCSGSPSVCTPICGDGLVRGGEACDDGNTSSGDGCSATCTTETGYSCSGSPSSCTPICGDGLIIGGETCDDGNVASGDGCSAACGVEAGYSCTGAPSSCSPICGDGLIRGGEACDDGNLANGDGCSATCTIESGFACTGEPSACDGICGDGVIKGTEACDDAAGNGTLPSCCSATCQFKSGGTPCTDGNACTTNDTCSGTANTCNGGAPPMCDDGNSCTADSCNPATGCVNDAAARNGFACDDGNLCTQGDVCNAGSCAGTMGADSDGDGYCDQQETTAGCNPNDPNEIPPQASTFGGKPVNGVGNLLVTYLAPTNYKVAVATDPSCATSGVCGGSGFCTSGKIADPCSVNTDCDEPAGTCRIVANYAEVPDLAVRKPFLLNKTPLTSFEPLTPGCSRKVDVTLDPARHSNLVKINVTGTTGGRLRRDADSFRYR